MKTALLVCLLAGFTMPAYCADVVQAFRSEFPVNPADLFVPDLPPDLAQAVSEGSLELRQQVAYDAPALQLVVRTFAVPPGAPPVTSMVDIQNMQIEKFKVDLAEVAAIGRGIRFAGMVVEDTRAPLSRVAAGSEYVFETEYDGSDHASFSRIFASSDGAIALFSPAGAGLVEIGDTPNHAPEVIVTPDYFESYSPEVRFDASASFDPDGDELDFKWRVPTGAASLRGCETPVATIQLSQGAGIYEVEVLVTDSKGASGTALVRVNYLGR